MEKVENKVEADINRQYKKLRLAGRTAVKDCDFKPDNSCNQCYGTGIKGKGMDGTYIVCNCLLRKMKRAFALAGDINKEMAKDEHNERGC